MEATFNEIFEKSVCQGKGHEARMQELEGTGPRLLGIVGRPNETGKGKAKDGRFESEARRKHVASRQIPASAGGTLDGIIGAATMVAEGGRNRNKKEPFQYRLELLDIKTVHSREVSDWLRLEGKLVFSTSTGAAQKALYGEHRRGHQAVGEDGQQPNRIEYGQ